MIKRWIAAAALSPVFVPACYSPSIASDYIPPGGGDAPPDEVFHHEDAGTEDACAGESSSEATSFLRFRVRTSKVGGKFAPRNVGAIWIQEQNGAFVKTLERWGTTRAKWLLTFNAASGGNVVDAITGATKIKHETHEVTWDLSDTAGCRVADGDYALWLELTDRSGAGVTLRIPFELSHPGTDVLPEDAPTFHDMALRWE